MRPQLRCAATISMPIMVFDLKVAGNIMRMAMGEPIGTDDSLALNRPNSAS